MRQRRERQRGYCVMVGAKVRLEVIFAKRWFARALCPPNGTDDSSAASGFCGGRQNISSLPGLLFVQNLSTFYGNSQALFDVNIETPERGAVAILGRNGAGKTTLLKSIVGELTPRNGSVIFEGVASCRLPRK